MKTIERMDYGFKNELQFRNNYASLEYNFKIQKTLNQGFVVPWQLVENDRKEYLVK